MAWEGSTRKATLPPNWRDLRRQVLRRDKGLCQIHAPGCIYRATDVDHKEPGDNHSLDNLQAACTVCHRTKSSREGGTAAGHTRRHRAAQRYRTPEPQPGRKEPTP